ncbi:hypothetical protein BGZ60DRAFT_19573 [Tricladium varicosporioides]|nr:hypothetical protein BGZ60DRAFT_19573 [Hymenoscyphus varicosporioides]
MIECLRKSASHGSVEASFILLFIEPHFPDSAPKPAPLRKPIMVKGVPIFESPMEITMQKIRKQGSLLQPRLQYISMIQLWNKENSSYVRDQPFNLQGTTFFWKKNTDMARFLDEVRTGPLSIWDITIEFESLDSSLQSAGFFEACAAFGTNAWWIMAMDFAHTEQNISTEQKQVVFYNCLIAALQNGQSFFIDTMEAQADEAFLRDLASTVIKEKSNSPFHFLPLYSTDDTKLQRVASRLLDMGFGQTINQNLTKRRWLRPLGVGVYGTPLHMAVRVRSLPAVKALMNAGSSPFEMTGPVGDSPLELAICLNLHEIVRFMLDGTMISDGIVQSSTRALGKLSDKGIFDNWLLHSRGSQPTDPLMSDIQRTIQELSRQFGGLHLDREAILLQYLEAGCKNAKKLKLLWRSFEKKDGYRNISSQTIEKGLALAEQIVRDDPLNRDLIQFFFMTMIPLDHSKSTETQPDALLLRWTKSGAIYNINDFSLHFKSEDWGNFVRGVNGKTPTLVDAAISSGCLRTFDFVMQHIPAEECLTRSIDLRAKECVTHVVKSALGTIYCKLPTTTALHHAAATSNQVIVQHLLGIRISRTTPHIQHLHPTSRSDAGSQTAEFRIFRWDPVFNMKDHINSHRTALDIAADADDTITIEALLGSEEVGDTTGKDGKTLLALAVKNGQVSLVKRLLMRQYSPYCVFQESGLTSLHQRKAALSWNLIFQSLYYTFRGDITLSTFERLLALCKDEDIKNIEKMNPLSFWRTDSLWNGWLPIHYAIFCGRVGIVRAVIAANIWPLGDETTQFRYTIADQGLMVHMSMWSNAFYYGELLERDYIEKNDDFVLQPKRKNLLSKIAMVRHKDKGTSSSPSSDNPENTRLDINPFSNYQYRYCHLWAPGKVFEGGLDQAHNLIWASKTCRQLALDLISWHDFVQLPYERRQQRTVSKLSRTEIVQDLDKWIREQRKMARINAAHSLDDHGPVLSELDRSMQRYIREVSEVGTAKHTPFNLPSFTTAMVLPDTLTPDQIVPVAKPTADAVWDDPHLPDYVVRSINSSNEEVPLGILANSKNTENRSGYEGSLSIRWPKQKIIEEEPGTTATESTYTSISGKHDSGIGSSTDSLEEERNGMSALA